MSRKPAIIDSRAWTGEVGTAVDWPVDENRKLPEPKAAPFISLLAGLLVPVFLGLALQQIAWSATNMPLIVHAGPSSRTFLIASVAGLLAFVAALSRSSALRTLIVGFVFGLAVVVGATVDYLEGLRTLKPASPAFLVVENVVMPEFGRRRGPSHPTIQAHVPHGPRLEIIGRKAYLRQLGRGDCLRGRYYVGRNGLVVLREVFPIDCALAERLAADW